MTSPIKILFKGYQMLSLEEKRKIFNLIKEEQSEERMDQLLSGIEVEHMTPKEKWILSMARDFRENAFYFKSK